jgi:hypothetical protein
MSQNFLSAFILLVLLVLDPFGSLPIGYRF